MGNVGAFVLITTKSGGEKNVVVCSVGSIFWIIGIHISLGTHRCPIIRPRYRHAFSFFIHTQSKKGKTFT